MTCVETAASKVASGYVIEPTDPTRNSTAASRPFASASMLSLTSIPATMPSAPTSPAISAARKPGPTPTSSTRSPGRNSSQPRTLRRCATTSGVR
jgi:hypothetical protein